MESPEANAVSARLVPTAEEFLAVTARWRARDPVGTNLMASVAQQVLGGRRFDSQWWFVAESIDGVVGAAMWTPPHPVAVAAMPTEAAELLAEAVGSLGEDVPGVVGPVAAASAFAARIAAGGAIVQRRERTLVLRGYVPPPAVPGTARLSGPDDVDLLMRWLGDFAAETGMPFVGSPEAVMAVLPRTWLWEDDRTPVALAGHSPVVETEGHRTGRIGPVFTPRPHRGRGYASAITAAVLEHLKRSSDVVMLFTDAANATSNGVYERLGFAHVDDVVELGFPTR